jgi:hypothetical protein
MSRRIRQNLDLRKDKRALRSSELQSKIEENAQFFDEIEGLSSLNPSNAMGGLYVSTSPQLGLRRVSPVREEELELAGVG